MKNKTINILGVEYTVDEVDVVNKYDARRGEIDFLTNVIKVDKNLSLSQKNHTLIHEIMHGMFDLLGMDGLRDDEQKIQAIATGIHQIFSTQNVLFEENDNDKK